MLANLVAQSSLLCAGVALLWLSGDWTVTYILKTARAYNVTTLFAGFVITAIATNIPELMVIISALWHNTPGLAAGNLLGSNVVDITITLGYTLTMTGLLIIEPPDYKNLSRTLSIMLFIVALLSAINSIHRIEGILLMLLYGVCLWYLFKTQTTVVSDYKLSPEVFDGFAKALIVAKLCASMTILLIASKLIVSASICLTEWLTLSHELIGSTLIAFGTALPEITLSINAVRRKEHSLTLGNILGSVLEKNTLLLGLLATLSARPIALLPLRNVTIFLMISCMVMSYGIYTRRKLSRYEGIALLALYAIFVSHRFLITK